MRVAVLLIGLLITGTCLLMLAGRSAQSHMEMARQANMTVLVSAINSAAASLKTDVQGSISNLNVSTVQASFYGTVACGTQTCAWTATRSTASVGGESQTVVVNGGGTRTNQNENTALDSSGNNVVNDLVYRLNLTTPANQVLPLDVTMHALDSEPIQIEVLGIRLDRGAVSAGSVDYADQLCGLTTISCAVVTSGADTTVVTSESDCFSQTDGAADVASGCSPIGDSSASPSPDNTYSTTTNNDGSIGGAVVSSGSQ